MLNPCLMHVSGNLESYITDESMFMPKIYKKFKPLGKRVVNNIEQYIVALEK